MTSKSSSSILLLALLSSSAITAQEFNKEVDPNNDALCPTKIPDFSSSWPSCDSSLLTTDCNYSPGPCMLNPEEECYATFCSCMNDELVCAVATQMPPPVNEEEKTEPPVTGAPVTIPPEAAPVPDNTSALKSDFRCGKDVFDAKDNCGNKCTFPTDCAPGLFCFASWNTCKDDENNDILDEESTFRSPLPTQLQPVSDYRCGVSEVDARGNCKPECSSSADCMDGESCWGTHRNYCHIMPEGHPTCDVEGAENVERRCGFDEMASRGFCGPPCTTDGDCGAIEGERCFPVHLNLCACFEEQDSTTFVTNAPAAVEEPTTDAPVPQPTYAPQPQPTYAPLPVPDPTPAPIRDSLFSSAPASRAPVVTVATSSPITPPTPAPVPDPTPAPSVSAIVPTSNGGCSVCGEGKAVGNTDAVFEFPGQPAVQCSILEMAGMAGAIPLDQCAFLPPVVADICDCREEERRELQGNNSNNSILQIKETNRQYFERAKQPLGKYFEVEVVEGQEGEGVTTSTGGNENGSNTDTNGAGTSTNAVDKATSGVATISATATMMMKVTVLVMVMSMMM